MISDVVVLGGMTVDAAMVVGLAFATGRWVEKIQENEKRLDALEGMKAEVSLATIGTEVSHLSTLVKSIQDELKAIAKLLNRSHTGLQQASGSD